MKLLLTSAGISNQTIAKALLELVGKPFKDLKLAFIPTSANVEEGGKEWLIDDLYNCKKLGLAEIDIVDFTAIPRKMWEPRLEKADILVFGGGNTFYLMDCLKKFGLDKMLPKMLENKVYVGISAGSMVAGKGLSFSWDSMLYYENTGKVGSYPAMGFVNLSIRPHLNSKDFPNVRVENLSNMAKEISEPVYALDDQSALKIDGEEITIVSEGEWKRFN